MPRYYFGENAARPILAGGRRFAFTITGMVAGAVQGVVEVPDDLHGAFLATASKYGVSEITREAYESALAKKKKNPRLMVCVDLSPPPTPAPASAVGAVVSRPAPALPPIKPVARPAVTVDGSTLPHAEAKETLPLSIDDAVDLGTAAPPPAELPKPKSRRRGEK